MNPRATTKSRATPHSALACPHPWHLRRSTQILDAGGVIAYPTEAVYGLGCDPLNAAAVMRILELKQRPMEAGLILIAADFAQLATFLQPLTPAIRRRVEATWPGPVTWLLPARPEVPLWLRGRHATLAVRVTAHAGTAALCRSFGGALVSTSANPRGREPARTPTKVHRYFTGLIDYVLPGSLGQRRRPSEIRDGLSGAIVRGG